MSVSLGAHNRHNLADVANHTHEIHVHLPLAVLDAAEFQRTAYSHSGVVDEDIDAALLIHYLLYGSLHVLLDGGLRLDVVHSRDLLLGLAVGSIDGMPFRAQPLGAGLAKAGRDSSDEYDHSLIRLLPVP